MSLFPLLILGKEVQSTRWSIARRNFAHHCCWVDPCDTGVTWGLCPHPRVESLLCAVARKQSWALPTDVGWTMCLVWPVEHRLEWHTSRTFHLTLCLHHNGPGEERALAGTTPASWTQKWRPWSKPEPNLDSPTPPSAHCEHRYVCCAHWHSARVHPLKIRQHNGLIRPCWQYSGSFY